MQEKEFEFDFHLEEGLHWMEEEKYEEALESFGRAASVNPNSPELYIYIAYALGEEKRVDEAIEAYGTALRVARANFAEEEVGIWWANSNTQPYLKALKGIGVLHYQQKRYEESLSHFCQILNLNPQDNLNVGDWLAESYLRVGQISNALEFYLLLEKARSTIPAEAQTADPEFEHSPYKKGQEEEEEYQKALKAFYKKNPEAKKELSEPPPPAPSPIPLGLVAPYTLGLIYFLLDDKVNAKKRFQEAVEGNPCVARLLLRKKKEEPSDSLEMVQALEYTHRFGDFWKKNPEALKLLQTFSE